MAWLPRILTRDTALTKVPAVVVYSDATLRGLARGRPTSDATLLAVAGIGPVKLAAYGEAL